ncbi:MAG: phenylalanine--tRNA ligase subunit beta [Clostridiaceae bacterium]
MKAPVKWLKDYVDIDISPKELGAKLTLSGSNVEEVISNSDEIQKVVTGKLLKIEKHPDAEKLVICQVQVGKTEDETVQIVTGAANMKEGDIVPTALNGSMLPNGIKIKKGKLRGVMSNGMMCSSEELGLPEKEVHGLMILDKDTEVGIDIKLALDELEDSVIDFEITSNRADCFSVLGLARETAATLNKELKYPNISFNENSEEKIEDLLEVEIKNNLCRRYMAKMIKNVTIAPSPLWMQERLILSGIRPINNIVDITNFINVELGQPMHAFDSRQIMSKKIIVDIACENEKFTTLDEKERMLNKETLCIKDGDRTVAIAGIMGGLNSEVLDDTTEVIFEFANFNGDNIRKTSSYLNLRTEASTKYEKDLDPSLTEYAMKRACHLIEELNAGEIVNGTIDVYPCKKEAHSLIVDSNYINSFLGIDISKEDMKEYLDRLELETTIQDEDLNINVPTFRGDINIKQDVAEEVARIYGYNNIPSTLIRSVGEKGGKNQKQKIEDKVIELMLNSHLNQSISYSFVSPKVFDKILLDETSELRKVVKIKNPLGEDFSIMRTTTIPSMMEALSRNYSRNNEIVRLFEIGKIYIPSEDINELPEERNILTIGLYGNCDYFNLKGIIENLLEGVGISKYELKRENNNVSYHPGKTAAILLNKEPFITLGEIHPDVAENYGVDEDCFIAEVNLDIIYKNASLDNKYRPLPKFPAVTRDIAFLVDDEILVSDIYSIMKKKGGNIVESIKLFDVYKGKQIPDGKKSIAYSIVYRAENKTLTDKEVNKVHSKILSSLEYQIGAELR